jgi:hypothetical protein
MPDRSSFRRSRRFLLTAISVVALVAGAFAAPAFAHGVSGHSKKCQEMEGMDMCGNGVYRGKGKAAKKAKAAKATLKPGTMVVIDGALTGDSPCEKSGPRVWSTPASASSSPAPSPATRRARSPVRRRRRARPARTRRGTATAVRSSRTR